MPLRNANPERGEVALEINGRKCIICAEMSRLASLSATLGTKSLTEIFLRVQGVEPFTMMVALDTLIVEGSAREMREVVRSPLELSKVSAAVLESLASFLPKEDDPQPEK